MGTFIDPTMTPAEIKLARRIVDLRGTASRARGNRLHHDRLTAREARTMNDLSAKGLAKDDHDFFWHLTAQGIQQLKLQIGEFSMSKTIADMVAGKPPRPKKPITIKIGKDVMSKDGRTPYAAGTIHATRTNGMMSPYVFSYETVARLLADDGIVEIQIIDRDNVQSTISKNWIERVERPRIDTSAFAS